MYMFLYFQALLGPGTYFIMILDPMAPFSQSMSPWGVMATHFMPETIILDLPKTQTSVIGHLES